MTAAITHKKQIRMKHNHYLSEKRNSIRHSFSMRLSLYIGAITFAVFAIATLIFLYGSKTIVKEEAIRHANSELTATINQIKDILHQVQTATSNMEWGIEEYAHQPDSMWTITRKMLEKNSIIMGSAVAFEPNFYPEKGEIYSPYSYRDENDEIKSRQLGTTDYDYHSKDWYKTPKNTNKNYWSEPYFDEGGADNIITTYSHILYDGNQKMYGILTADVSLDNLTKYVNAIHPYPSSYTIMISRNGTYLVHPLPERILHETIYSATADMQDSTVKKIGDAMINGENGMFELQNDDTLSYVFYAPIPETDWSVAVICPHREVFAATDHMSYLVLAVFTAGLLLLLSICVWVIYRTIRPLHSFSEAVIKVAHGELDVPIPHIKTKDELGQFSESFRYMQSSLNDYINQLTEATAVKERVESELLIARRIQMGMLPKIFPPFPDIENLDLYGLLQSAREVGGDLYDFFLRGENLFFTIGDVSGKGVPASLFMAITRSLFRIIAGSKDSPAQIANILNHAIADRNEANMFITMYIGVLNINSGELTFCNAGHNPPVLVLPDGKCDFQEVCPNLPIGVLDGFEYEEQTIHLPNYATLLLYTDGLNEAENILHEQFGEARLMQEVQKCHQCPVEEIVTHMQKQVMEFAGSAEQSDDLTLLAVRLREKNKA